MAQVSLAFGGRDGVSGLARLEEGWPTWEGGGTGRVESSAPGRRAAFLCLLAHSYRRGGHGPLFTPPVCVLNPEAELAQPRCFNLFSHFPFAHSSGGSAAPMGWFSKQLVRLVFEKGSRLEESGGARNNDR